jgi:hypothetical protein
LIAASSKLARREIAALLRHQRLQVVAIPERPGPRGLPDPLQEAAHSLRRLGHRILQPIGGEGRKTQEPGALLAQAEDLDNDGVVVVGVVVVAPRDEGLVDLLAQVAPGGALQERLDGRTRQRDDRLAFHAALAGCGPGGRDKAVREAVAIGLAEFHEPVLLVAKQMMAERRAEMGQPFVDLRHPRLGGVVEPGT